MVACIRCFLCSRTHTHTQTRSYLPNDSFGFWTPVHFGLVRAYESARAPELAIIFVSGAIRCASIFEMVCVCFIYYFIIKCGERVYPSRKLVYAGKTRWLTTTSDSDESMEKGKKRKDDAHAHMHNKYCTTVHGDDVEAEADADCCCCCGCGCYVYVCVCLFNNKTHDILATMPFFSFSFVFV